MLLVILLGMLACYLWLSWAFSLFPDAGVERIAGRLVAGVIRDLCRLSPLPGLMIVVLIFSPASFAR